MTTDDQDKAIQALMAKEGYVTASVTSIGVLGAVAITGETPDGSYHFHTVGPDGSRGSWGHALVRGVAVEGDPAPTADELGRWWNPNIRAALTAEVQRLRQTIDLEDGHITAGVVTITYLIDGWRMCAVYQSPVADNSLLWAGRVT